jgi:polysaccharide export outer membrane protein
MKTFAKASVLFVLLFTASLAHAQAATGAAQALTGAAQAAAAAALDSGATPQALPAASQSEADRGDRAILAMATPDYPVTPGDVYRLAYIYSSAVSSISVTVDSGYRVNLSLFGTIDARGLTLAELQKRAADVVLKTFPGSGPQLFVESVGIFQVYVKGEVTAAGWVSSWGLSRLSSIVGARQTPYSSTRDVEVASASGVKARFDLFLAARSGRKELDPYVRPQDTIVVNRRSRAATVVGEVERPGTYQLLDGEDLEDLVRSYGGGFTKLADAAHLQITRWGQGGAAQTLYVNDASQPAHVELRDLDVVRVP